MTTALEHAKALIRLPSITPNEAGTLDYLERVLKPLGFACHRLPFGEVDNLYARRGEGKPHLCFAGHVDVVDPGPLNEWRFDPFAAHAEDGILYGRGAADMKGNIACWLQALEDFIGRAGDGFEGSLSMLITGDEEGKAVNGTVKVLEWMKANGQRPDHCLVGEPSCSRQIGDVIKTGRRGSLGGIITITGRQGHVAYPHLALNPITGLNLVISALLASPLDEGTENFDPSNLEFTNIEVGNSSVNVIPGQARAWFNIRFNDAWEVEDLKEWVRERAEKALAGGKYGLELDFTLNGDSFLTRSGELTQNLAAAIRHESGIEPELSTSGGTSDARFIKDLCPVIEFGLLNATIHKTDEHVSLKDMELLTRIYSRFLKTHFKTPG